MNKTGSKMQDYLYGFHAVKEAWLNPKRKCFALYVNPNSQAQFEPVLEEAKKLNLIRPKPQIKDAAFFSNYLKREADAVHQHIILEAATLVQLSLKEYIQQSAKRDKDLVLVLDQITDPHNIGAIIRSAAVFGCKAIIVQDKHSPDLSALIAKIAAGGCEHVHFIKQTNLSATLDQLKQENYWVYGLGEEQTVSIDKVIFSDKVVLVMGAEGSGLRKLVKEHCDQLITIPNSGAMSTLNVSNAAAISLFLAQKRD